ncbi:TauD/TfdA family dioxygenase [Ascidiimonas sp. W6]|uniref:TauD/TfdA family dioxygenase n=1 Tax=Ascidiimonas meishanensis TaxID=3128903 RepID=UPI0030EF7326
MITKNSMLPHIMETDMMTKDQFVAYYKSNHNEIEKQLEAIGAIKFQGVSINNQEDFQWIIDSISEKFLSYIDGNSPRTKLSGNVYTSTEYDKTQIITMHNELSYSHQWPGKLFFSCLKVAETGGETLLADSRELLNVIDKSIVEEVEKKGVTYIRNLHGGMGMGPSWQNTFETEEKAQVEAYCKKLQIEFEWKADDSIRLIHKRDGIIKHRNTGVKVWFNQIDQFHPSHLGEEYYETIKLLFENPNDFPMYVEYGDGSQIEEAVVKNIINSIESVTVAPKWDKNEILLVDNELVSHGRNPYTGDRRVLVSMSL